jgi:hypothetical protein
VWLLSEVGAARNAADAGLLTSASRESSAWPDAADRNRTVDVEAEGPTPIAISDDNIASAFCACWPASLNALDMLVLLPAAVVLAFVSPFGLNIVAVFSTGMSVFISLRCSSGVC